MTTADGTTEARRGSSTEGAAGFVRAHAWALVVGTAMVCWSAVVFAAVHDAYTGFRLGRFDLGNMVQAVWSTTHGRPLEETDNATGELMVRLGGHADPFLVLLAPVWMLWPSPLSLALAQIVVVSLGAIPVFWLARRHLENEHVAGILALAYLAYPWVATSAYGAIHPVTFAISFLLFCAWFLDTDRLAPFAVFALLTMSTGELMGLPVLGLGIWFALARGRRLAGAVIACGGVAWTLFAIYVVVPHYSGRDSQFFGFYDEVGGSPAGVVRMLFSHPATVLGALVESQDIAYLLWLTIPLLGLFFLSPGLAAVALPQLLANGLSDFRSMTDPRYHSVAAVIPFLIAATVLGIRRIRPSRRGLAVGAVLVCSATISLVVGPWARVVDATPLGGRPHLAAARIDALADAVAAIPDGAPVTVSNSVGAHLSARRYVYSVPDVHRASWVVIDLRDPWVVRRDSPILTRHPEVVRALASRLERDPAWTKVFEREGVLVFRSSGSG
jgi:uncharacterized membrane protein